MSLITYQLLPGVTGGTVNQGGGILFNIGAAIAAGGGSFTVDDQVNPQLAAALDSSGTVFISGTTPGTPIQVDDIEPLLVHSVGIFGSVLAPGDIPYFQSDGTWVGGPPPAGSTSGEPVNGVGITGATSFTAYAGGTAGGPPVSGNFLVGHFIVDRTGQIWICTTAGAPGTWTMAGAGIELGYADLSTDPAAITTAETDITGLSITFVAPARFELQVHLPFIQFAAAANNPSFHISDSANTVVAYSFCSGGNAAGFNNILDSLNFGQRLPTTGTGGYAITPGTSYTFKLRGFTGSGTANIKTNTGTSRPCIRAVSC